MNSIPIQKGFDWDNIKYGVTKGQRHAVLTWYFNYLVEHRYSRDEALTTIINWNRLNKPPLPPEDVVVMIRGLEKHYLRVISKSELRIPRRNENSSGVTQNIKPKKILIGARFTEAKLGAAVQKNITHKGRHYEVSSAFNDEGLRMPNADVVIETCLPVHRLNEIALGLDGEICGKFKWLASENISDNEWASQFVRRVREAEQLIVEQLAALNTRDRQIAWLEIHTLDNHRELFEQYLEQK